MTRNSPKLMAMFYIRNYFYDYGIHCNPSSDATVLVTRVGNKAAWRHLSKKKTSLMCQRKSGSSMSKESTTFSLPTASQTVIERNRHI